MLATTFQTHAFSPRRTEKHSYKKRVNTSADGFLGGFVLDMLFGAACPGLATIFTKASGLSALDIVDLYDHARDAFNKNARRRNLAFAHPSRHPACFMRPRCRPLLALLFG